jgi:hypothetical protein
LSHAHAAVRVTREAMSIPIPPDVRELLSHKYTGTPFPMRGADRVCFVIAVEKAAQRTLNFTHDPGSL